MFSEWKKFMGWVTIEYFMKNPNSKIHIKGLSKKLKISPGTSYIYLKEYEKSGVLRKETAGNVHLYSLDNENPLVKAMKRAYIVSQIMQSGFLEEIRTYALAAALYGSSSSGDYTESSDIDIIVIGDADIPANVVRKIESFTDNEAGIPRMSISEWKRKKESGDFFIQSVLRNSVILLGERI